MLVAQLIKADAHLFEDQGHPREHGEQSEHERAKGQDP